MNRDKLHRADIDIAVVGMAGRFPGAANVDALWRNLLDGVESVARISDEEWARAIHSHPAFLTSPNLVKARPKLDGVDLLDAAFFGLTPRAAQVMDPQQRIFLECTWDALEHAGHDSERFDGLIGVIAGMTPSTYLLNLVQHSVEFAKLGSLDVDFANRTDSFATRVGYKLNLKGPCYSVQSYCSTSLVAVHLACQGLRNGETDMVLAGGSTINLPQDAGYTFMDGGIFSSDGKTRTFDAKATGVVFGNGVAVVALRRLSDAIADGDTIYSVIRGSAINNDGSLKVGFTAPSVSGQTAVIEEALRDANVNPETIGYIEAHGTATALGDPAEVAALTKAYRRWTEKKGFCGIGSLKPNVGHLDAASGVTGLIKATLAVKTGVIPKMVNFETPNPQIDFANSPFFVTDRCIDWQSNGHPRRAGVSAMGVGGTNAHIIIEQAPELPPTDPARPWQLLVLSARSATALDQATANLRTYLADGERNLADVAYTLQVGRRAFDHRRAIVCKDREDAIAALADSSRQTTVRLDRQPRSTVFMFSGQGSQYVDMGLGLYRTEPVFRDALDDCSRRLQPHLGFDLVSVLYPSESERDGAAERLKQTAVTQPALFAVEYALARLWKSMGIEPAAMIGHSIGEYTAACLAGVFSLDDALALVAYRGQVMQSMPPGAMLSVQLSEEEVAPLLAGDLCLAAANGPSTSVVAGSIESIDRLERDLTDRAVMCRRLQTSHAFHSSSMDAAVGPFKARVAQMTLGAPAIRFVSNLTGTWITDEQATDPGYWADHLRGAVRFSRGIKLLIESTDSMLVEVGPGNTLASLARLQLDASKTGHLATTLRHPRDVQDDRQVLLNALGKVWLTGAAIAWPGVHAGARRRRVALPTYPFERQSYWVERDMEVEEAKAIASGMSPRRMDIDKWFYQPSWRRFKPAAVGQASMPGAGATWVVFCDPDGLGSSVVGQLRDWGQTVVPVHRAGTPSDAGSMSIDPRSADDYHTLVKTLSARKTVPTHIVHLWGASQDGDGLTPFERTANAQALGFYSLMFLTQALGREDFKHRIRMAVVTSGMQDVLGGDLVAPEKATVLGPCRVIPQEFGNITCVSVDVDVEDSRRAPDLALRIVGEAVGEATDLVVAYRHEHRWVHTLEPTPIAPASGHTVLRERGVYLITGGTGGIGLVLAGHLARDLKAKLILTARSPLPPRTGWSAWIEAHGEGDAVSGRIRQIEALEAAGAEVLTVAADVTNLDAMRSAIDQARERFGALHGVIHTAGVAGAGIIQMKQPQVAAAVLGPKVEGTLVLDALLRDQPLDFLALCSSTAALAGGFGQVDYCAANAFLDAFAHHASGNGRPRTLSINWDMWSDVGMGVNTSVSGAMKVAREATLRLGISSTEGVEAFRRVLAAGMAQTAVVPMDIGPALLRMRKPRRKNAADDEIREASTPDAAPAPAARGDVPVAANDLERTIALVWNEVLGRMPNPTDNFFELGGDSMTAIQVTAVLKARLGRDIPIVQFYEAPTVALLAAALGSEKQDHAAAMQGVERRAETRLELMQRRRRVRADQPVLESAS